MDALTAIIIFLSCCVITIGVILYFVIRPRKKHTPPLDGATSQYPPKSTQPPTCPVPPTCSPCSTCDVTCPACPTGHVACPTCPASSVESPCPSCPSCQGVCPSCPAGQDVCPSSPSCPSSHEMCPSCPTGQGVCPSSHGQRPLTGSNVSQRSLTGPNGVPTGFQLGSNGIQPNGRSIPSPRHGDTSQRHEDEVCPPCPTGQGECPSCPSCPSTIMQQPTPNIRIPTSTTRVRYPHQVFPFGTDLLAALYPRLLQKFPDKDNISYENPTQYFLRKGPHSSNFILDTPHYWGPITGYADARKTKVYRFTGGHRLIATGAFDLVERMFDMIVSAEYSVDILTYYSLPYGHFRTMLVTAVQYFEENKLPITIRIYSGFYVLEIPGIPGLSKQARTAMNKDVKTTLDDLIASSPQYVSFVVVIGDKDVIFTNHGKMILVDGFKAIFGGTNLWDKDYLTWGESSDPVFPITDVNIEIYGYNQVGINRMISVMEYSHDHWLTSFGLTYNVEGLSGPGSGSMGSGGSGSWLGKLENKLFSGVVNIREIPLTSFIYKGPSSQQLRYVREQIQQISTNPSEYLPVIGMTVCKLVKSITPIDPDSKLTKMLQSRAWYDNIDVSEYSRLWLMSQSTKSIVISQQAIYSPFNVILPGLLGKPDYGLENASLNDLITILSHAIARNVEVSIIHSATGGSNNTAAGYQSYQEFDKFLVPGIIANLKPIIKDSDTIVGLLSRNLKLYVSSLDGINPSAQHDKFWMVDDKYFYIGSHNMYWSNLFQIGVIVESTEACAMLYEYWLTNKIRHDILYHSIYYNTPTKTQ